MTEHAQDGKFVAEFHSFAEEPTKWKRRMRDANRKAAAPKGPKQTRENTKRHDLPRGRKVRLQGLRNLGVHNRNRKIWRLVYSTAVNAEWLVAERTPNYQFQNTAKQGVQVHLAALHLIYGHAIWVGVAQVKFGSTRATRLDKRQSFQSPVRVVHRPVSGAKHSSEVKNGR